ncbi:MAG: hypothetical protein N4A70_05460 [Pelagimonas sp.]|jgi:hypothetical protein|nr:hypothetical protein [Pelagimonas sp.]
MNKEQAAKNLDGSDYWNEGSKELFETMKKNRLVAVFGASDDLIEFRGAICDELGAGDTAYITPNGLLTNDCESDECPHFLAEQGKAAEIDAIFCPPRGPGEEPITWIYMTDIEHAQFQVVEDGDIYCLGIVFSLDDVPVYGASK